MSEDLRAAFPRRQFLSQAAYLGAGFSLASALPFPALSPSLRDDPRISQTPVVDAGFASVRKIADGMYATISDPSKGLSTMCNGGFLFGKDAALLVEGFVTASGAAFQMDALRKVSQVPAVGALDSHYHYDHSLGNAFYGANGPPNATMSTRDSTVGPCRPAATDHGKLRRHPGNGPFHVPGAP